MSTVASVSLVSHNRWFEPDRIGVVASVLCAIHCAVTPFLLMLLPTFGKAWSHPASHWGMALVVVPVAAFTIARGFCQHGRRWVVATGVLGISLILVGATVPYLKESPTSSEAVVSETNSEFAMASVAGEQMGNHSVDVAGGETEISPAHANEEQCASQCENEEQCASQCESEEQCASQCESAQSADVTDSEPCEDLCCPTLQASADGGWELNIPLASILTTLGGLCLIATHVGNLCGCAACTKATQVA